ncbi:MAG: hypothetical protein ACE5DY_03995 [Mariprofundaceae bacterium]
MFRKLMTYFMAVAFILGVGINAAIADSDKHEKDETKVEKSKDHDDHKKSDDDEGDDHDKGDDHD